MSFRLIRHMISLVVAGAMLALVTGLFAAQSRQVQDSGSADRGAHESGIGTTSATEPLVDIASRAAGGCVFYSEPERWAQNLAVIGFAIGAMVDQENFRNMAQAAGGTYYNASSADALIERIRLALYPSITYAVLDERGRKVTKGRFGDRHTLKEGAYTVVVPTREKELRFTARIEPNAEIFLSAPKLPKPLRGGESIQPPASASSAKTPAVKSGQTQPRKPKTKAAAKFCTQCGARLKPGANFCTQCGAKAAR